MSHSRYPVGNGKFCYSGSECKIHGWKQSEVYRNSVSALQETIQNLEDQIHTDSLNIQHPAELGVNALLTGYGASWCQEHNCYHVYSSSELYMEVTKTNNSLVQKVVNVILESQIPRKSETFRQWVEEVRTMFSSSLTEIAKRDKVTMQELQEKFRTDPDIDPEVLMDAFEARKEQRYQARLKSDPSLRVKEKVSSIPLRPTTFGVSDKMLLRYWQCGRKRGFNAESDATHFVGVQKEVALNAYHCKHCSQWHVGHGDGSSSAEAQVVRARNHWESNPVKVNRFVLANPEYFGLVEEAA